MILWILQGVGAAALLAGYFMLTQPKPSLNLRKAGTATSGLGSAVMVAWAMAIGAWFVVVMELFFLTVCVVQLKRTGMRS